MSVEAMSWVFKHSPYELGERLVHLALADVANDTYENRLWMTRDEIAAKCLVSVSTVSRATASMVRDGYLERIEAGGGRGKPSVYRLLFPRLGTVSNREGLEEKPSHLRRETLSNPQLSPLVNSNKLKGFRDQRFGPVDFSDAVPPEDVPGSVAELRKCLRAPVEED